MIIQVTNGVGSKVVDYTGLSIKAISVDKPFNKIEIYNNGILVYSFVNEEGYEKITDDGLDIPIIGNIEIKLYGNDGFYNVFIYASPFIDLSSEGKYLDTLLKK